MSFVVDTRIIGSTKMIELPRSVRFITEYSTTGSCFTASHLSSDDLLLGSGTGLVLKHNETLAAYVGNNTAVSTCTNSHQIFCIFLRTNN